MPARPLCCLDAMNEEYRRQWRTGLIGAGGQNRRHQVHIGTTVTCGACTRVWEKVEQPGLMTEESSGWVCMDEPEPDEPRRRLILECDCCMRAMQAANRIWSDGDGFVCMVCARRWRRNGVLRGTPGGINDRWELVN
jgi:hypothetical protein